MDPTPPTPWAPASGARPTLPRRAVPVLVGIGVIGLALGSLVLAGCDDASAPPEETDAVTGTTGSSTPDGYPAGPYGADVGEVMPNLAWKGYVDDAGLGPPTDRDLVPLEAPPLPCRQAGLLLILRHAYANDASRSQVAVDVA